jgi:hypothetical protein
MKKKVARAADTKPQARGVQHLEYSSNLRHICEIIPPEGHVLVGNDEDEAAAHRLLSSLGKENRVVRRSHPHPTWSR